MALEGGVIGFHIFYSFFLIPAKCTCKEGLPLFMLFPSFVDGQADCVLDGYLMQLFKNIVGERRGWQRQKKRIQQLGCLAAGSGQLTDLTCHTLADLQGFITQCSLLYEETDAELFSRPGAT